MEDVKSIEEKLMGLCDVLCCDECPMWINSKISKKTCIDWAIENQELFERVFIKWKTT